MTGTDVESVLITQLAKSRDSTLEDVLRELEQFGVIDSLEGVELVAEAEMQFGISISDSELSSDVCRSVPALAKLVRSKLSPNSEVGGGTGS